VVGVIGVGHSRGSSLKKMDVGSVRLLLELERVRG
jgi:hypothetical protein